jgi:hypothetical protein
MQGYRRRNVAILAPRVRGLFEELVKVDGLAVEASVIEVNTSRHPPSEGLSDLATNGRNAGALKTRYCAVRTQRSISVTAAARPT